MTELYKLDPIQKAQQEEVYDLIAASAEKAEYKRRGPMYILLRQHSYTGHIVPEEEQVEIYNRGIKAGLIKEPGHITQAGLDWLAAPLEL